MNPSNISTPSAANGAVGDENRLRDALAGYVNPAMDPSLPDSIGHTTPNVTGATWAQNIVHGGTMQTPVFGNTPKEDQPRTPHANIVRAFKPRNFLRNLPAHEYILPRGGPLNFTIAEIIAVFPNWFRNRDMAIRFQNNGINGGVHLDILEEYRNLNLTTTVQHSYARDHLSDSYRLTMRLVDPNWTKNTHKAPKDWNASDMTVNGFLPDAARDPGYVAPPSILFKDLAAGLKKLPQGYEAGDLTRALDFAMQNQKIGKDGHWIEFMFPDDIHRILDHIGRAQVTIEHTDAFILRRRGDVLRKAAQAKNQELAEERRKKKELGHLTFLHPQQGQMQYLQPVFPQAPQQPPLGAVNFPFLSGGYRAILPANTAAPVPMQPTQPPQERLMDPYKGPCNTNLAIQAPSSAQQDATAAVATKLNSERGMDVFAQRPQFVASELPDIPDVCKLSTEDEQQIADSMAKGQFRVDQYKTFNMGDMDALMASQQAIDFSGLLTPTPSPVQVQLNGANLAGLTLPKFFPDYPPTQLLRDCVEGDDETDRRGFARAVRWARQFATTENDFTVGDVELILQVIDGPEFATTG